MGTLSTLVIQTVKLPMAVHWYALHPKTRYHRHKAMSSTSSNTRIPWLRQGKLLHAAELQQLLSLFCERAWAFCSGAASKCSAWCLKLAPQASGSALTTQGYALARARRSPHPQEAAAGPCPHTEAPQAFGPACAGRWPPSKPALAGSQRPSLINWRGPATHAKL